MCTVDCNKLFAAAADSSFGEHIAYDQCYTGSIPTHMTASNMSRQNVFAHSGIAGGTASRRVSQLK